MLILLHPEVAYRDCTHCQEWLYEDSGSAAQHPRTGEPLRRPPGNRPLCRIPGKSCPKGTPEAQKSFTPQNEQCYRHYLECKATNQWPDDPLVRRHAGLIRRLEEQVDRVRHERLAALLGATLGFSR